MATFNYGEAGGEPYVEFTAQGQPLVGNWWNSSLFTHRDPQYDHYFVEVEPDQAEEYGITEEQYRAIGAFIWRHTTKEFDDLANFLVENDYIHIHRPFPDPEDVEAYKRSNPPTPVPKEEPKTIVEDEDEKTVQDAMKNIDAELKYYLGE